MISERSSGRGARPSRTYEERSEMISKKSSTVSPAHHQSQTYEERGEGTSKGSSTRGPGHRSSLIYEERGEMISKRAPTKSPNPRPSLTWSDQFHLADIPTFGDILSELADKIGNLITDAENNGEVLLSSAGAQIASAIEYAKASYIDALDITIDKITNLEKGVIDDITTEIGYVEHHVIDQLRLIVERGSIALNTLPLSNHFPQVGWYTPSYIAPDQGSVEVEFNGNFFDSAREGYDPTLVVAGNTLTASSKTTLKLGFTVPVSILKPTAHSITRIDMELTVPYRKVVAVIFYERDNAKFNASIILLPPTAGSIEFDTDLIENQHFTQPNRSGEFIQESTDDDIPDPIGSGRVSLAPVTPGWFVNPADVHLQINWAVGDWSDFGNRSNVTTAAWSIATRHHGIGESGKVHFVLLWTEYQDRPVHVPTEQSRDLTWGSSRLFQVPSGGTWTAKYTDFTGKEFDIGSAAFDNPYIQVSTSGDSVIITTVP